MAVLQRELAMGNGRPLMAAIRRAGMVIPLTSRESKVPEGSDPTV